MKRHWIGALICFAIACGEPSPSASPNGGASAPTAVTAAPVVSTATAPSIAASPPLPISASSDADAGSDAPSAPAVGADATPIVRGGKPIVTGEWTPELITNVVMRDNVVRIRRCYADVLRGSPGLTGTMKVRFVVDKTGTVSSSKSIASTVGEQLTSCVVAVVGLIAFPQPEKGVVRVDLPLTFGR
jgi:hypothetical protein